MSEQQRPTEPKTKIQLEEEIKYYRKMQRTMTSRGGNPTVYQSILDRLKTELASFETMPEQKNIPLTDRTPDQLRKIQSHAEELMERYEAIGEYPDREDMELLMDDMSVLVSQVIGEERSLD